MPRRCRESRCVPLTSATSGKPRAAAAVPAKGVIAAQPKPRKPKLQNCGCRVTRSSPTTSLGFSARTAFRVQRAAREVVGHGVRERRRQVERADQSDTRQRRAQGE